MSAGKSTETPRRCVGEGCGGPVGARLPSGKVWNIAGLAEALKVADSAVGTEIEMELDELLTKGIRIGGRIVGVILIWADFLSGGSVPPIDGPQADVEAVEVEEDVAAAAAEAIFGIRKPASNL